MFDKLLENTARAHRKKTTLAVCRFRGSFCPFFIREIQLKLRCCCLVFRFFRETVEYYYPFRGRLLFEVWSVFRFTIALTGLALALTLRKVTPAPTLVSASAIFSLALMRAPTLVKAGNKVLTKTVKKTENFLEIDVAHCGRCFREPHYATTRSVQHFMGIVSGKRLCCVGPATEREESACYKRRPRTFVAAAFRIATQIAVRFVREALVSHCGFSRRSSPQSHQVKKRADAPPLSALMLTRISPDFIRALWSS